MRESVCCIPSAVDTKVEGTTLSVVAFTQRSHRQALANDRTWRAEKCMFCSQKLKGMIETVLAFDLINSSYD
jgi:hypothetical protein